MEYPICYVVKDIRHETYVYKNPSYVFSTLAVEAYYNDEESYARYYYCASIKAAKRWSEFKKIKRYLTAEVAKYFVIVGSDKSVTYAVDLFKED